MEKPIDPDGRKERLERNISDFKRILITEGSFFSRQLYWSMAEQIFFWNAELRQIKWDLWKRKSGKEH